jgi:alkanesulfonate monooxygenase SsuD/methylene tetrahydromethanopterin reductase-like flavin-dependent oxidoreductase (luciferase family)
MHQMWAPQGTADADFFSATTQDIVLADELGFDSVWIAEHHYVRPGPFYSRLPDAELLLAMLVPRTRKIRLATGIKLLILDDPERVAEKARLLSLLSGGRMLLGLGQGSPDELGVRQLSTDEKRAIFRERLDELVSHLEGSPAPSGLAITPACPLTVAEAVWVGVRDETSVAHAARIGANFLVGEAELAAKQAPYVGNYRSSGGLGEARGARLVCVAETREQALADVEGPARLLHDAFSKGRYHQEMAAAGLLSPVSGAGEGGLTLLDILGRLEYAVGTAADVATLLLDYITTTGVNALNIVVHAPGIAQQAARRSMRLFMADVASALLPALTANNP